MNFESPDFVLRGVTDPVERDIALQRVLEGRAKNQANLEQSTQRCRRIKRESNAPDMSDSKREKERIKLEQELDTRTQLMEREVGWTRQVQLLTQDEPSAEPNDLSIPGTPIPPYTIRIHPTSPLSAEMPQSAEMELQ